MTWIVALIVGWAIFSAVYHSNTEAPPSNTSAASERPKISIDKSPAKQAQRERFIKKLIAQGLVEKVDTMGGTIPKIYIRPAFYNLDLDTKRSFASVVYAYYFDGSNFTDTVILRDSRTGKDVGNYNPNLGGLKMN